MGAKFKNAAQTQLIFHLSVKEGQEWDEFFVVIPSDTTP